MRDAQLNTSTLTPISPLWFLAMIMFQWACYYHRDMHGGRKHTRDTRKFSPSLETAQTQYTTHLKPNQMTDAGVAVTSVAFHSDLVCADASWQKAR